MLAARMRASSNGMELTKAVSPMPHPSAPRRPASGRKNPSTSTPPDRKIRQPPEPFHGSNRSSTGGGAPRRRGPRPRPGERAGDPLVDLRRHLRGRHEQDEQGDLPLPDEDLGGPE